MIHDFVSNYDSSILKLLKLLKRHSVNAGYETKIPYCFCTKCSNGAQKSGFKDVKEILHLPVEYQLPLTFPCMLQIKNVDCRV